MQYTIMLTKQDETQWRAIVAALPGCVVEAPTREAALAQIKERLIQTQPHVEFVQVEVPDAPAGNGQPTEQTPSETWPYFGAFAGDPNWGAFFEELDRQRQ